MTVRPATSDDAPAIARIYAPYIKTPVTFEEVAPDAGEMRARLETGADFCPWLVYDDGEVRGYAYAGRHRVRRGYRFCAEVSVYVAHDHQQRGLGRALYSHLFAALKSRGIVNLYAGIAQPDVNRGSVRLHESLGFRVIGIYEKIGVKDGIWYDVGWWGLRLEQPPQ